MIVIIAAMDEDSGIGKDGGLPWDCPEDMAFFRRHTYGNTVVMGRKTADSLEGPLPGRRNVVITRDPGYKREGFEVANDLELALLDLKSTGDVFVIGGADIYKQTTPLADCLLLTEIPGKYNCDTMFPEFDPGDWDWHPTVSTEPNAPTFNKYTRIT